MIYDWYKYKTEGEADHLSECQGWLLCHQVQSEELVRSRDSDRVKDFGPEYAQKIVWQFGRDKLEVIEEMLDELCLLAQRYFLNGGLGESVKANENADLVSDQMPKIQYRSQVERWETT